MRKHNRNTYLKYGCRCGHCVADNARYKRERKIANGGDKPIRLDATILLNRLERDGMLSHIPHKMRYRWLKNGVSVYRVDEVCVKLGYHPINIYGQDFYQDCFS